MNKQVTLKEMVGARIVPAVCAAVYYWCWARNDWENYYDSIQNGVAIFAVLFLCLLASRERKYKKEVVDEMAEANLKKCDSICYRIFAVAIVCIAFLSALLRFTISSEVIGYLLMGLLVAVSIVRTVLFCYLDTKGD